MNDIWWQKRFYSEGCRLTMPRKVVIQILLETKGHLSANEIYKETIKRIPSIGMTTIYRTLDLLIQIGLVQKFDFGDKKTRYEMTNSAKETEYHHHLICVRCKSIIDYNDYAEQELQLMKEIEKTLSKKYAFEITHHTIYFYGLCKKCRQLSLSSNQLS